MSNEHACVQISARV